MSTAVVSHITPSSSLERRKFAVAAMLSREACRTLIWMHQEQQRDQIDDVDTEAVANMLRVGQFTARRVLRELEDADVYRWRRRHAKGTGWHYYREVTWWPGSFTRDLPHRSRRPRPARSAPVDNPPGPVDNRAVSRPARSTRPRAQPLANQPISRKKILPKRTPLPPTVCKTSDRPDTAAEVAQVVDAIADSLGLRGHESRIAAAVMANWTAGDLVRELTDGIDQAYSPRKLMAWRLRHAIGAPPAVVVDTMRVLRRGAAQCATHPGCLASNCGGCRADRYGVDPVIPRPRTASADAWQPDDSPDTLPVL